MSKGQMHTTRSYADQHGLTPEQVRYHCANDNLECVKLAGAGHGVYLIPDGAVIKMNRVGRKIGWRKKKDE